MTIAMFDYGLFDTFLYDDSGGANMGTTYSTLRQNLMKLFHAYRPLTATSQGGAAGASYISTDAQKWDGGNDDHYNGRWLITTSGSTKETVYISDYATATGTFTPRPVFSAQIANAVTAEVLPFEPVLILDAFQRAIDQTYPKPEVGRKGLFKTIFEEMVANSRLWDGHFEDWTLGTIPDHWTKSGTCTVSEETTIFRGPPGTSAVKMTGGGATDYIYQSQAEVPGLLDLESTSPTFYVWAYASAASKARLTIAYQIASGASLTTASSSYHTGNSEWELLSKQVSLPQDITDLQIRLESSAGTVYFDNCYHDNGPYLYRYHLSKDILHDPISVQVQRNNGDTYGADMVYGGEAWDLVPNGMWGIEDDGTNRLLVLNRVSDGSFAPYTPISRRKIRVTSNETLTLPTTDTDTVEVTKEQMRALVVLAACELMLSIEGTAAAVDSGIVDFRGKTALWRAEAERLLNLYGMPMPMNHVRMR